MTPTIPHSLTRPIALIATTILLGACADDSPVAPDAQTVMSARFASVQSAGDADPIATIRRATARYHDIDAALADGFVFLHGCETRPDEGPAGELYVHFDRLLDGVADPRSPDALLYEPRGHDRPKLVGVELATPYALWPVSTPQTLPGTELQSA